METPFTKAELREWQTLCRRYGWPPRPERVEGPISPNVRRRLEEHHAELDAMGPLTREDAIAATIDCLGPEWCKGMSELNDRDFLSVMRHVFEWWGLEPA